MAKPMESPGVPVKSGPETRLPHDSGSSHGAVTACETTRENLIPQPGGEESRHV